MEQLKQDVVAVLAALADVDDGEAFPKSSIYLALESDLDRTVTVESFLIRAGMVVTTAETIRLTARGRAAGERINAALA